MRKEQGGQESRNSLNREGAKPFPSIESISSIPSMSSAGPTSSADRARSIESIYSGLAANAALVLIGVAVALLDRQLAAQADAFEKEGGFTERLYQIRQRNRREK